MLQYIWLIPILPLVGVGLNTFFGRRYSNRVVGLIAAGVVLAAFVLSVGAVWELSQLPHNARFFETELGPWIPLGDMGGWSPQLAWGFALDTLSAVLLLVVTGVGFLIHVYSIGYMSHEQDVPRFFIYMNLFMAMMLTLTLGSNLLVVFVGWEGVGLCSYLLIGFFYDRPFDERTGLSCADAGRKAFIVNRIGDFAFMIGMLFLVVEYGTLNFRELSTAFHPGPLTVTIGLLLFFGACGKSAQIPLFVWLPDAMAGPTPVSALIHAATMVTAGVYMICRMSALFSVAPEALAVVATVGAMTAFFAATMGVLATDIKKVLAYSTVSQLGFMFAAAGVGAYSAAMFHLMTHAFFKALLFLGAGSVIHGMNGIQDIRKMGGLRSKMPRTFLTFCAGWLAIAGIVPFAGFFSKDEILAAAWSGNTWVWAMLVVAAFLTAFHMTRLVYLVFFGKFRGSSEEFGKVHESPASMTVPLIILALLSVFGGMIGINAVMSGWVGVGDINFFHHWVSESVTPVGGAHAVAEHGATVVHNVTEESLLIALALAVAAIAIFIGLAVYRRAGLPEKLAKSSGPLYVLIRNLYWVDELYELILLRPFYFFSRVSASFDRWVIDGLVNATGVIASVTGQVLKLFQTGLVRNYALLFLLGVVGILYYLISL
jgi:NADH-quinone oxidoreductase subunit L